MEIVDGKVRKQQNIMVRLFLSPEVGILIPLLILCAYTWTQNPRFLSVANFSVILIFATFVAVIAIGQSIVIMSGEIDLSVGLNAGFSGIIFGYLSVNTELHPALCILGGLMAGGTIGFLNGYLVSKFGLVNFVTTLATMFLCWGLAVTISGGRVQMPLHPGFMTYSMARPLGLSWSFFIFLGIFIIVEIVVRFTTIGRKIKAVGGNKEAAQMAGINVMRVKWGAYTFSGILAAVGGIFAAINMAGASPEFGPGIEFRTITACAVGGISFTGGAGSILGLGIGILFVNVLDNALQLLRLDVNWQLVITGFVLVIAVTMDIVKKRIQSRNV